MAAASTSDSDSAVLTKRLGEFAYLTPVLYMTMICTSFVGGWAAFVVGLEAAVVVPVLIGAFSIVRFFYWSKADVRSFAPAKAESMHRWLWISSVGVAVVYSVFLTFVAARGGIGVTALATAWITIAGAVCSFCLYAFPKLARIVLVTLIAPMGCFLALFGEGFLRPTGLTMLVLMGLLHLILRAVKHLVGDLHDRADMESTLTAAAQRALNDFLSVSHDYNFETDADGRLVRVSENFHKLIDAPAETLLGKSLQNMANTDDPITRKAMKGFEEAFARREAVRDLETRGITIMGRKVATQTSCVPIVEDGVFQGYRGWIVDISEQRHAEAVLAQNEARFRDFATLAADCLWETDEENRYTYLSDKFAEWTGVPVEQMIGTVRGASYSDYSSERFREVWENHLAQIAQRLPFRDCVTPTHEGRVLCSDGSPRFAEDGTFLGYRGYTRDITEEYEAKKAADAARAALEETNHLLETRIAQRTRSLRERTELLAEVLNTMSDGLVVLSSEGSVEMMNERAADALPPARWEVGTAFASTYDSAFAAGTGGESFNREDEAPFDAGAISGGEPFVHYRRTRDGRAIRENYTPRAGGGFVVSLNDITSDMHRQDELKALSDDLMASKDAAEAASRAKSEFLANMSHEIRTPMNGVLGMAELLMATELSPKQRDMAEVIQRSGDSLLTIINDILDFSKLEVGKMSIAAEPFDVRAAVEDVASLVSPTAQKKGLELLVRIQPDLPLWLMGDAGRFRQVITNLVGNAVKFTSEGQVLIDLRGRCSGSQVNLEIAVEDTGCGIPENKLEDIFNMFEQVDGSTSRSFEGTGLGLSISKKIAAIMGGDIHARSRLGEGSEFTFKVALSLAPGGADAKVAPAALDGLAALVVDDNAVNRLILEEQLSSWGMVPDCFERAEDAIRAARERAERGERHALAIIDHQMPEMNGEDLSLAMQADPALSAMPRIMLTSAGQPGDGKLQQQLGLAAYLVKPLRSRQLLDAVTSALTKAALRTAGEARTALRGAKQDAPEAGRDRVVLVAEDNMVNQLVVKTMLADTGYTVHFAGNGEEAVALFEELAPDLVMMDVSMPVMDGLEATRTIREASERGADVPIIGVTAHALAEDRQVCLDAGMSDYLPKPIKKDKLLEKLAHWGSDAAAAMTA